MVKFRMSVPQKPCVDVKSFKTGRFLFNNCRWLEMGSLWSLAPELRPVYWTTTVPSGWLDRAIFVAEPIFHHCADLLDERNRLLVRAPAKAVA
jgi:hypothetical protein